MLCWVLRARLFRSARNAERATGACVLGRQLFVGKPGDVFDVRGRVVEEMLFLTATDDPEGDLRKESCSFEDQSQSVQWDELTDEEHREGFGLPPPRSNRRSSAPT